jgi:hypothetical protein
MIYKEINVSERNHRVHWRFFDDRMYTSAAGKSIQIGKCGECIIGDVLCIVDWTMFLDSVWIYGKRHERYCCKRCGWNINSMPVTVRRVLWKTFLLKYTAKGC